MSEEGIPSKRTPIGINIEANGLQVEVRYGGAAGDFISLTDIAKYRTAENPRYVIQNWMRTRNTVRFLGLWEHFHNPEFNYLEFEAIEREAHIDIADWLLRERCHPEPVEGSRHCRAFLEIQKYISPEMAGEVEALIEDLGVEFYGKVERVEVEEDADCHPEAEPKDLPP